MTGTSRNARKAPFLPEGVQAYLRRRAVELAALAVAAVALALALALASYDPTDPSLNTAAPRLAHNWLGGLGAVIADLAIQTIGWAAWLAVIVIFCWGWAILRHHTIRGFALRLALLPLALLLAAIALAPWAPPVGWASTSGLGGFTGTMLLGALTNVTRPLIGIGAIPIGIVAGILAVAAAVGAAGLRAGEWRAIGCGLVWLARRAGQGLSAGGRAAGQAGGGAVRLVRAGRPALRAIGRGERDPDDQPNSAPDPRGRREPRIDPMPAHRRGDAGPEISRRAVVEPKAKRPAAGKRAEAARQATLDLGPGAGRDSGHELPPLDLLLPPPPSEGAPSKDALEQNARLLETVLGDFNVRGEIVRVRPGPVVAQYELEPAPGTKSARVIGLADDIARSMSAISVRVAVVPGRSVIGIELPNQTRDIVALRELLASDAFERTSAQLALALGKDIGGAPVIVDLARLPHLLVAGTTGSGKSVAINTMILSLIYRLPPDQCRFVMIDPKMLELSVYDGIPHLLAPVVTEPSKAVSALKWAVREMETRYRLMSTLGVRNIAGYNARIAEALKSGELLTRRVQTGFDPDSGEPIFEDQALEMTQLPFIVVVVDEMADLMLVAGREVEAAIQRLAQMARAAGIHLIMATQRPSVDVITGTIKANFPARVSFQVTSKIDSRTILGESGAEQLLGQGDMLYMAPGGRITRVHGPLVTDEEVDAVTKMLKDQAPPVYVEEVTAEEVTPDAGQVGGAGGGGAEDALYDQAVALVCRERKASTSFVQRHLQIGYNRAARLIERMEAEGVISRANHVGKREVLARDIEDREN